MNRLPVAGILKINAKESKVKKTVSYKDSGVDKQEGYKAVAEMKAAVGKTHNSSVLGSLGAFASLYSLEGWKEPVLVSGTDGVGTKLRLALDAGNYKVIGRDCYAMVANDILCHGATPLFFLDYIACGRLESSVASSIVEGMADACAEDGCALVGGETAEMPGFYAPGDYDAAGFAVGAVEKSQIIDGSAVRKGNAVIGIASSGVHSNGYSLVRSVFAEELKNKNNENAGLLETLLVPTKLYGKSVRKVLEKYKINGMAHITGGGIPENLPRAFAGSTLRAVINTKSWVEPEIFSLIREKGVNEEEMRGTFNLGIGFILIVEKSDAEKILEVLASSGEKAWIIGSVEENEPESDGTVRDAVCFV